jgi:hypothetical protein
MLQTINSESGFSFFYVAHPNCFWNFEAVGERLASVRGSQPRHPHRMLRVMGGCGCSMHFSSFEFSDACLASYCAAGCLSPQTSEMHIRRKARLTRYSQDPASWAESHLLLRLTVIPFDQFPSASFHLKTLGLQVHK